MLNNPTDILILMKVKTEERISLNQPLDCRNNSRETAVGMSYFLLDISPSLSLWY